MKPEISEQAKEKHGTFEKWRRERYELRRPQAVALILRIMEQSGIAYVNAFYQGEHSQGEVQALEMAASDASRDDASPTLDEVEYSRELIDDLNKFIPGIDCSCQKELVATLSENITPYKYDKGSGGFGRIMIRRGGSCNVCHVKNVVTALRQHESINVTTNTNPRKEETEDASYVSALRQASTSQNLLQVRLDSQAVSE